MLMAAEGKDIRDKTTAKNGVRVVDLCCGMGGLSVAAREMGMTVVAGVDVNPSALRTFSRNFPDAEAIEGSVRSRTVLERCRTLLDSGGDGLSIVLSGPPCQGFSAAGSRDPKDRRNGVLVAVARAIAKIEPDCAVIENVSTVLAEKHGDRLESFRQVLGQAGYHVEKKVLDSSEYRVPQKRKRAFFFVTRRSLVPQRIDDLLARHKVPPVTTREALHGLPTPPVRPDNYDDEAEVQGPANHFAMRHSKRVMDKIAAIPPGTGPMSYRRLHPTKPANTLFSGHRAPPAHFAEPRSITVREAARLQGFPDTFRVYGTFANQMEQVTNAVPPPLARVVLSVLVLATHNVVRKRTSFDLVNEAIFRCGTTVQNSRPPAAFPVGPFISRHSSDANVCEL
jgi:DNA (cytosine-5)-methyltransferase 1